MDRRNERKKDDHRPEKSMKQRKRSQEEMYMLWMMLDLEFMKLPPASNAVVGQQVLEYILWKERVRLCLDRNEAEWTKADRITLAAMQAMDDDDPTLLALEKMFKRLATGNHAQAIVCIRKAIDHAYDKLRKRQSEIAKKPRRARHPLSTMVEPIVKSRPDISENELFHSLKRKILSDTASEFIITTDIFRPVDRRYADVPRSSLKHYLYRAKKKVALAG
jgi:hypothetical protein